MKCRHIKQACDCSVVRIWDNRKVLVSLCRRHSDQAVFSQMHRLYVYMYVLACLAMKDDFFEKAAASSSSGGGSGYGN